MVDLLNVINDLIVLVIISYILCAYMSMDYATSSRMALIRRLASCWLMYGPLYVFGNIWLLYGITSINEPAVIWALAASLAVSIGMNILLTRKDQLWHYSYVKMNIGFSIFIVVTMVLSYFGVSIHLLIRSVFLLLMIASSISMYKRRLGDLIIPINMFYVLLSMFLYCLSMAFGAFSVFESEHIAPLMQVVGSFIAMIGYLIYYVEKYSSRELNNDDRISMSQFQLREAYDEIEYASSHDIVTGLKNWKGLKTYFEGTHNYSKHSIIVNVNLKGMGSIRSWVTEKDVEKYLKELAEFLTFEIGHRGKVFRAYNGNFVLVCPMTSQEGFQALNAMIENIRCYKDFSIDGHNFALHCGIANVTNRGSYEDDFKRAGIALRQIELSSNSGIVIYDVSHENILKAELQFERELKEAVDECQWEIHYQPKYRLRDGEHIGVEALIRWKGKKGIAYSPNHFIAIAEKKGWLDDIEKFVVVRSLLDFKQNSWFKSLAINISPYQLRDLSFIEFIINEVKEIGVDPSKIVVEVTESAYMENFEEAKRRMSFLHQAGIKIALDDFGSGYSSLRYLTELPFDEVKIDQAFVRGKGDLDKKYVLLSSLAKMLHQQGFDTVIEGVESEEVYIKMQELGISSCQGYYLSKPESIDNLSMLLNINHSA